MVVPTYADCEVVTYELLTSSQVQKITVVDNVAPEFFTAMPAIVAVPFLSSRTDSAAVKAVPLTNETATPFFISKGLTSHPITLTSFDTGYVGGTENYIMEKACGQVGMASFKRQWEVKDACNNVRSIMQTITVLHHTTVPTTVQSLLPLDWALAVDVVQRDDDPCLPGKTLSLGTKTYSPLAPYDQCADKHWRDDGCRIKTRPQTQIHILVPMKPRFMQFPVSQSQCVINPKLVCKRHLDSRCVLVPVPWVLGPKHASTPAYKRSLNSI